jgi:hypothetical protein
VTQVCGVLDGELVALEAQLEARNKVREERALLQRFLGMAASIDKIEKLLATASDEAGSAQHGKLVERVASEYNQLQFYVTHSRDHPFVVRMQAVSSRTWLAKTGFFLLLCLFPFSFHPVTRGRAFSSSPPPADRPHYQLGQDWPRCRLSGCARRQRCCQASRLPADLQHDWPGQRRRDHVCLAHCRTVYGSGEADGVCCMHNPAVAFLLLTSF